MHAPDSMADTIVACATQTGGALAVVRLSGPRALELATQLCGVSDLPAHRLRRAVVRDEVGAALDDAMVVAMPGPRSYTGDDVVEFHLHGSAAVVDGVLQACRDGGARTARPGEFTLRAFLNGKMDLSQAEAVADLVGAGDGVAASVAGQQLRGDLSKLIHEIIESLESVLADWRAAMDFTEHATGDGLEPQHRGLLDASNCKIQQLMSGAQVSLSSGFSVVLCGAPNVGKSSLVNAWTGTARVLVDPSPGTTRDAVEVPLADGAVRWTLWDTAGIRNDPGEVEAQGIALAKERMEDADAVVWLVAADAPEWPQDAPTTHVVVSKSDLLSAESQEQLERAGTELGHSIAAWVSSKTGTGVDSLRRLLMEERTSMATDAPIVTKQRHVECLQRAKGALERLLRSMDDKSHSLDVWSMELEQSVKSLGEILGRDVDGSVLDRIFSEFCIGK